MTRIAPTSLFLALALTLGCGEDADDFSSEESCNDYCAKNYDCDDVVPSDNEMDACIADCRNDIEDNCGNDQQVAANDKINECVDKACDEFETCMVFDAAPECFAFVGD